MKLLKQEYLDVPAGDEPILCKTLRTVISIIGKEFESGKGSYDTRGRRYLKRHVPGCKTKHIKFMLCSVFAPFLFRLCTDNKFRFRFSLDSYVGVFAKIVEIVDTNPELFSEIIKNEISSIQNKVIECRYKYSTVLIREPFRCLSRVGLNGNEGPNEVALTIRNNIMRVDKDVPKRYVP